MAIKVSANKDREKGSKRKKRGEQAGADPDAVIDSCCVSAEVERKRPKSENRIDAEHEPASMPTAHLPKKKDKRKKGQCEYDEPGFRDTRELPCMTKVKRERKVKGREEKP